MYIVFSSAAEKARAVHWADFSQACFHLWRREQTEEMMTPFFLLLLYDWLI